MTSTNPITQTGTTPATQPKAAGPVLGKDDFLKLLVGQLQHQDPMEPSNDTEFIGQMAQFSALEQESNTAESTSQMADQLGRSGALGLIGKTVTYTDAAGLSHTAWYATARAVEARLGQARAAGLGVGLWRLGNEDQETWTIPSLNP